MNHNLEDLRVSIDTIDSAVLLLLAERFHLTKKVGELKRDNNLPAIDKARERRQFVNLKRRAQAAQLDTLFVEKMWRLIIDTVVEKHKGMRERI